MGEACAARSRPKDVGALFLLVVVLVVVVLVVLIVNPAPSRPMRIEHTFRVSMTRDGDDPGTRYAVDGVEGATLHLKRGRRYRFVLEDGVHPLYLTSDPRGGPGVPGTIASNVDDRGLVVGGGDLEVITEKNAERGRMYYQSTLRADVGGAIEIV